MTILVFTILLFITSFFAGLLGALTGLGGGIIIIPVLVLVFQVDIHYAMGASLIAVMATSSGAAAAYLREGYTNLRIGMFLEVAAVIGALVGALLISRLPLNVLTILFSLFLFLSAYLTLRRKEEKEIYATSHRWAAALKLEGTFPLKQKNMPYHVQNLPLGFFIMGIAGLASGLLGIGSGTLKVLAMDQTLRLPYKVATTTSNFMIGITAAVSIGIYYTQGFIHPLLVFPVMLGVILGALLGARQLAHINTRSLRIIFSIVLCFVGVQMLYKALLGGL